MMGPYRNHPVLLVKYILICMFIGFVLTMTTTMVEFGLLALIPLFLFVRIWFKTRYTFTEDGIEVERSTAFKTDTNIPYSKVSSINVVRTILDRLLGTVTVSFNINSGVNASTPEVSLVLDIRTSEELKAFVESETELQPDELREALKQTLPPYMIPKSIVIMKTLPISENGKIDRRRLAQL